MSNIVGPRLPGESVDDWAYRVAAEAPPLTPEALAFVGRAMGADVAARLSDLADADLRRSA